MDSYLSSKLKINLNTNVYEIFQRIMNRKYIESITNKYV